MESLKGYRPYTQGSAPCRNQRVCNSQRVLDQDLEDHKRRVKEHTDRIFREMAELGVGEDHVRHINFERLCVCGVRVNIWQSAASGKWYWRSLLWPHKAPSRGNFPDRTSVLVNAEKHLSDGGTGLMVGRRKAKQ